MSSRVFNFGAGPAMLPTAVMEKAQAEFLNYDGLGASIVEISHRSKDFDAIVDACDSLIYELSGVPKNYKLLYVHGGARMQFSAMPMNLLPRSPAGKMLYFETGNFAKLAHKEAARYGEVEVVASGADTGFDRIPDYDPAVFQQDASYVHLTSNNTLYGTRWNEFPDTGDITPGCRYDL